MIRKYTELPAAGDRALPIPRWLGFGAAADGGSQCHCSGGGGFVAPGHHIGPVKPAHSVGPVKQKPGIYVVARLI